MMKAYQLAHDYKLMQPMRPLIGLTPQDAMMWAKTYHQRGLVPLALYWLDNKTAKHGKRPIGDAWAITTLDDCLDRFTKIVTRVTKANNQAVMEAEKALKFVEPTYLNIGILTGKASDLIVLDFDLKKDSDINKSSREDGLEFYRHRIAPRLDQEGIKVPFVITGSGGLHLYFRYSVTAAQLYCKNGHVIDGVNYAIDVKTNNGMIVAAPSMHYSSGRSYQHYFTNNGMSDVTERPEIPKWLFEMLFQEAQQKLDIQAARMQTVNFRYDLEPEELNETMVIKTAELVSLYSREIANNYDTWWAVCIAILRYLQQSRQGLYIVDWFSRHSDKYTDKTTEGLIESFLKSSDKEVGYGIGYLINLAKRNNPAGFKVWERKYPLPVVRANRQNINVSTTKPPLSLNSTSQGSINDTVIDNKTDLPQVVQTSLVSLTELDNEIADPSEDSEDPVNPYKDYFDHDWANLMIEVIKGDVVCYGPIDRLVYLQWQESSRLWSIINYKRVIFLIVEGLVTLMKAKDLDNRIIKSYANATHARLFELSVINIWVGLCFEQPTGMGDWLPINNGTKINVMTNDSVLREREDRFTHCLPFNLSTIPTTDMERIEEFFKMLSWGYRDDFLPWFLWLLRFTLTTRVDGDQPLIINLYGKTLNCKSTLTEALMSLLGPVYSGPLDKRVLYQTDDNGSSHDSHLVTMRDKRVCCFSELGTAKINSATIKRITGGDRNTPRGAHGATKDVVTFVPYAKIWIATNLTMNLDVIDDATARRIVYIALNCQFITNPTQPGQFKADPDFKNWLVTPAGSAALLNHILTKAPKQKVPLPEQIIEFSQSIKDSTPASPIDQYCQAMLTKSDSAKTLGSVLWTTFQTWCSDNKMTSGNPIDFGLAMKKRFDHKRESCGIVYRVAINKPDLTR